MTEIRELAEAFLVFNQQAEILHASHARLEAEVARLNEELSQKNKLLARRERLALLGEMAAGVAHEIRNPLGGIHLYADLLGRSLPGDGGGADLLDKLKGGIRHLNRIVEDLLLYTREIEIRPARCRLDHVLEEALAYARPDLEAAGIRLVRELSDPPPAIEADSSLLVRVVLNLVKNSIQASPPGAEVRVAAAGLPGGGARLEVADAGRGIDPAALEKIFHPFFTGRPGGTGLGLSICHRIVDAHGGAIDVESEVGIGSLFRVDLPPTPAPARSGTDRLSRRNAVREGTHA